MVSCRLGRLKCSVSCKHGVSRVKLSLWSFCGRIPGPTDTILAIIPFFRFSKVLGQAGKQGIFPQIFQKILDLKSSPKQIFSENLPSVPLKSSIRGFKKP